MRLKVKEFFKQENNSARAIFSTIVMVAFLLVFSPAVAQFLRSTGSTGWGYGYGYGYGIGYGYDGGTVAGYRIEGTNDATFQQWAYGWGWGNMAVAPVDGVYTVGVSDLATLYTTGLVSAGTDPAATSSVSFNDDVTVNVTATAGTISVAIPAGAIFTRTAGGNFDFTAVTSTDQTTSAAVTGQTTYGAVQFGISGVGITSSAAVTITVPIGASYNGQTMNVYLSDTSATAGYSSLTTCVIGAVTSGNCVFTTTTFSYFATTKSSGGGGGGGGGGGSSDTSAPTSASISINSGDASTASLTATLALSATDNTAVTQMAIANTSDFAGAAWETYSTSKTWTLTAGNGTKTVYAKFKDAAGNVSSIVSDTITVTGQDTEQVVVEPTTEIPEASRVENGTYTYEYVGQSAYPATLAPGASVDVWIDLKNTGTSYWYNSGSRITRFGSGSQYGNANQQRDYNSEFADVTWPSANRAAKADKIETKTGETARFAFKIKAPTTPGVYKAYFAPVADGYQWMQDIGIFWKITVAGAAVGEDVLDPNYDWQLISQSAYPATLAPGATTNVWIEVKNTGKATWKATGANPLRLGSGSKYGSSNQMRDYTSEFANPDWLSPNRPTAVTPSDIIPGWHTRFQFNIKAPDTAGTYKAYFTPVIDGMSWMKDIGLFWQLTVQ
jgi:hypothetical protein